MKKRNWLKVLSCSVFATLYLIVAVISLICSTEFFKLAHSGVMSWVLAIGFEIGAMSCLLSTLILPKKKLGLVWFMFVVLTLFQCMGNMYAAFVHLENFSDWIDMFGLSDMELIAQKRVLAGISGVILPLVALGFIRIMADVLQDGHKIEINDDESEEQPQQLFGNANEIENSGSNKSNIETEENVISEKNKESEIVKDEETEQIKIEEPKEPEIKHIVIEPKTVETKTIETKPVETKIEKQETKPIETAETIAPEHPEKFIKTEIPSGEHVVVDNEHNDIVEQKHETEQVEKVQQKKKPDLSTNFELG